MVKLIWIGIWRKYGKVYKVAYSLIFSHTKSCESWLKTCKYSENVRRKFFFVVLCRKLFHTIIHANMRRNTKIRLLQAQMSGSLSKKKIITKTGIKSLYPNGTMLYLRKALTIARCGFTPVSIAKSA